MTRILAALSLAFAAVVLPAGPAAARDDPPAPAKFARGAKPSPLHKVLATPRFPAARAAGVPAEFAAVPRKTSMWGNDRYGDCVSAQEAFALTVWSTRCLGPDREVCPTDAEVVAFARRENGLDGADLVTIMDAMAARGMKVGGVTYKDGSYYSVDYTAEAELQAAVYVGPVNLAMDANALPAGAGNADGWFATGQGRFPNTDHCTALCGYGSAKFLYQKLYDAGRVPTPAVPAGLDPAAKGYLFYTWNTIGFVDLPWVKGTVTECYVRNPTTVGMSPPPDPTPTPPPPVPPPVPPVPGVGFTGTLTYANGVLVAVTPGAAPVGPAAAALEAELKGAGVSPAIIADLLQLAADVKAKKGFVAILGDVMKIIADLQANPTGLAPRRHPDPAAPAAPAA